MTINMTIYIILALSILILTGTISFLYCNLNNKLSKSIKFINDYTDSNNEHIETTDSSINDIYNILRDNRDKFAKQSKSIKELTELSKELTELSKELTELSKENKDTVKLLTTWSAQVDVALINLINVPYLYNELEPGFPKEWTGEIKYPINEVFVGSTINIGQYNYTIKSIDGKNISISRE